MDEICEALKELETAEAGIRRIKEKLWDLLMERPESELSILLGGIGLGDVDGKLFLIDAQVSGQSALALIARGHVAEVQRVFDRSGQGEY